MRVVTAIEIVEVEQQDTGRTEPRRVGPGLRHWVPGLEPLSHNDYSDHSWTTRCDENTTGMIVELTTADRVSCLECQAHFAADYLDLEPPDDGT